MKTAKQRLLVLWMTFLFSVLAVLLLGFSIEKAVAVNETEEMKAAISAYTESSTYHVETILPTDYGTVLYFWPVGTPHGGKSPHLVLIKADGSKIDLSTSVRRTDLWHTPEHANITLSKDGKKLTFSVSFDERSEGKLSDGETVVLHEAGTYYYETSLETGETVETEFRPLISSWAQEYVEQGEKLGITDAITLLWTKNISREQFCELVYNMLDKAMGGKGGNDYSVAFTDTDNKKVLALADMGIVTGKGNGLFDPKSLLSREEAATILDRIGSHANVAHHEVYYLFDDEAQIADWARNAVQNVCNMGIMQGVGNHQFSPKGAYTAEQAVATLVRIYSAISVLNDSSDTFADKMNAHMPEDRNYMFSPLSIKMALLMAANGASGITQEEILETTGVDDLAAYNEEIKKMLEKYSQSELLKLTVSNSIWLNSDKTTQRFSKSYTKKLADVFGATADVVNDKNAVSRINGWVNEKTSGKIPAIISEENKDFWAMLVNAVYFKGRWLKEFNQDATQKDSFTSRSGEVASIDFMHRTAWMQYAETDGVTIVSLPYQTREDIFNVFGEYVETRSLEDMDISMYLLMGEDDFSPEKVLQKTAFGSRYIALSMPKFKVEYSTGLNEILQDIGIQKAFNREAEFSDMFNSGTMWIDSVIHKTYISVDEEGTEAAAVTALGMAGSALPPEPIEVKFNKPFTFVIKDNTNGEILFMGEYAYAK